MPSSFFSPRSTAFFAGLLSLCLTHCSTELSECEGPQLNLSELKAIKRTFFSGGTPASLIVPNPIDASEIPNVQVTDTVLSKELAVFSLPDLLSPQRLENSFLRVRIQSIDDSPSRLAAPNASGAFQFPLTDVHYGETMAYYSISAIQKYIETLGFSIVKTRPLYVFVRAKTDDSESASINALYSHNALNPSLPRLMRFYGDGPFAPSIDRDMYWHEFGHFVNESVTGEVGLDFAGDTGAVFTEASALHECLADYIAESMGDKGHIGKWIARNFPEFPAGAPLRSAEPRSDDFNDFQKVSLNNGNGGDPERYRMAEWCTRVLWDIRSQILSNDQEYGAIFADRMIFSALSTLERDASMSQFKNALKTADDKLHCGLHSRSISAAFEKRGFVSEPQKLNLPLTFQANPIGINVSNGEASIGSPTAGGEITFLIKIRNPNSEVARNVRIVLESLSPLLLPTTYMQAFGDLPAGATLSIGNEGLSLDSSLFASIDKMAKSRSRLSYRLRIKIENGPESISEGDIGL